MKNPDKLGRRSKIPLSLHGDIMEMYATKNLTGLDISKWLFEVHNIKISDVQVNNLIRTLKEERKDMATAAYATAVAKSATIDLKIFDNIITKFAKKCDEAIEEDKMYEACKIADTLFKYQAKRMDMSGMNSDKDAVDKINELKVSIYEKLEKIK